MILCQSPMKACRYVLFPPMGCDDWKDWLIFQGHSKHENVDKNEKIRQKVSKLLISQEEFAGKLLKVFSKKLDEIQAADRDLALVRNT